MKAKKMLSLLLAVMMVCTMLPINAMAAVDATKPSVEIELSALNESDINLSDPVFGADISFGLGDYNNITHDGDAVVIPTILSTADYNKLRRNTTAADEVTTIVNSVKTELGKSVATASALYDTTKAKSALEVAKEETVYVGLKVNRSKGSGDTYKGMFMYALYLEYPDTLELDDNNIAVNMALTGKLFRGGVTNAATAKNTLQTGNGITTLYGQAALTKNVSTLAKYSPDQNDDSKDVAQTGKKALYLELNTDNAMDFYIPDLGNTWDIIVPFKVSNSVSAGTEMEVKVAPRFKTDANKSQTATFQFGTSEPGTHTDPNSVTTDETNGAKFTISQVLNPDQMTSNKVTLTVASNEPMIKAVDASKKIGVTTTNVTERKIKMRLTKSLATGTVTTAEDGTKTLPTDGWEVSSVQTGTSTANNASAAVTKVEVTGEAKTDGGKTGYDEVTLTVNNIPDEGTLTVKATGDAVTSTVSTAVDLTNGITDTVDIIAVPTGVSYNYTDHKLTNLASDQSQKYKIGDGEWTETTNSSTETVLDDTGVAALSAAVNNTGASEKTAPVVKIDTAENITAGYTDTYEVLNIKQAAKPAPVIDYVGEQVVKTIAGETITKYGAGEVEYGFAAASDEAPASYTAATAAGIDLDVDANQATTPKLFVRVPTSASALASLPVTLTIPARPTGFAITAPDDVQTDGSKLAGSTIVSVTLPAATDTVKYWDNDGTQITTPGNSDITTAGSKIKTLTVEDGKGTIAGAVKATSPATGDYIYAYTAAVQANPTATPAVAGKFRSAIVEVTGQGNDFGTVSASGDPGTTTIKVKMLGGDKWVDSIKTVSNLFAFESQPSGSTLTITGWDVDTADSTGNTIALTTSGDLVEGDYVVTVADGATTGSNDVKSGTGASELTGKVKFNASANGYVLIPASGKHNTTNATAATFTAPTATVKPGETTAALTVTGMKDYEELSSVTVNVTNEAGTTTGEAVADAITDLDKAAGTFKFKAPTGEVSDKVYYKLTVNTAIKKKTLDASNVSISVTTKTYDGTTALDSTAVVSLTGAYTGGHGTVSLAAKDDSKPLVVYAGKDVGTTAFDLSNLKLTGADADAGYYELDVTTGTPATGSISPVAASGISVDDLTVTAGNDAGPVVEALKKAAVTMNGTIAEKNADGSDMTLADALNVTDAELEAYVDAAVADKFPASAEVPVDAVTPGVGGADPTLNKTPAAVAFKKGDTFKVTLPDGYTIQSVSGTGYTLDAATGVISTDKTTTGNLTITVEKDGVTDTVTVTPSGAIGDAEPDYSKATGQDITVKIPAADIGTKAKAPFKDNYTGLGSMAKGLETKVTMNQGFTPTPSGGFGVTLETQGYGSISSAYIQADSEGKILELPEVTNVVKGAYFKGWSTEKGNPKKIIDVKTFKVEAETTLYAVYEGYVVGTDKGLFEPTRNVTRAELAKMLVVATGNYDPDKDYGTPSFPDAKGAWYSPFIAAAEDAGFFSGDQGKARPTDPITRNEAASMIARAFNINVTTGGTTSDVSDFDTVPDWAKDVVAALCNNGTINGRDDGKFHGVDNIQRSEVTQMVNKNLISDSDKAEIAKDTTVKSPFADVQNKADWYYTNVLFASLSVPASYYSTAFVTPTK